MYSPRNPYFNLSEEGQKEFGHIFPEGVPVKPGTFIREARLQGSEKEIDLVVLVDWARLSGSQQMKCFAYISEKFGTDMDAVRAYIEAHGNFPMRKQYIIEAYDMRFFI